jgi:hypothetical protein
MESQLTADSLPSIVRDRPVPGRLTALALVLVTNLLVVGAFWFAAFMGWGRFWMPVGYDLLHTAAGTILLSQYLTLGLWSSLSEPRSPFRWLVLVAICAVCGLIVAVVLFPAWRWQFVGRRWGLSWGVVFWELYVNWMLIACSGVVFLLAADIAAWPCRRMFGCRLTFGDQPVVTPAARGFGLMELFWWVGMAAAGCWLLRAMLENVLAENLAIVLIMLAVIIPPGLFGSVAALTTRRRWAGFALSIVVALAYGAALGGILWTISTIARSPQNLLLAYIGGLPFEVVAMAVILATTAAFANASALRWSGARLDASLPNSPNATQRGRR